MSDPGAPEKIPPLLPLEPAPPGGRSRKRWWAHLVVIGSFPLVIGLLSAGRHGSTQPALGTNVRDLAAVVGVEMLVFGVVFGVAWFASRATREDLLWPWRPGCWVVPLGVAYSVGIRLLLGMLVLGCVAVLVLVGAADIKTIEDFALRNRPDVEAIVDPAALRNNPVYFWLTVTVVSFVLGGFREELWRSAFLAGMKNLWPSRFGSVAGQLVAAAVAAVVFGVGHIPQGILAVFLTGLLGFGLGLIMVLHRSIWPAVVAHGVFNATSLALLPWVFEKLPQLTRP